MRQSDRKARNRRYALLQCVQWILFLLLVFLAFVYASCGSGIKPLLLLPLALCISSYTGEIIAMAVGLLCGLLIDISCGKLLGYNAIWLIICCVAVSLLHNYYLYHRLVNILVLTFICVMVQGYMDFVLYYGVWGYEDVWLIYRQVTLPSGIATMIGTVFVFGIVKGIAQKCGTRRTNVLEKAMLSPTLSEER